MVLWFLYDTDLRHESVNREFGQNEMSVNFQLPLKHFLQNINVFKNGEKGSNAHGMSKILACDLEIFFPAEDNGEIKGITLEDILYLFTGLKKIPPFELHEFLQCYVYSTEHINLQIRCHFTDTRVRKSNYICNQIWRMFWSGLTIVSFT